MFNRYCRLFLLAMIGALIAATPSHAQDLSKRYRLARLSFVDVSLDEPAGGVRQSQPFTIDEKSYRLFVRDTDVMTARGPHDRICVEAISHPTARDRPHFLLTLTSVGPGGRGMVTDSNRFRPGPDHTRGYFDPLPILPETICNLLPRAKLYRIWRPAKMHISALSPETAWRAPAVFDDFVPMRTIRDIDPIEQNLNMMMQAINMDGVCAEIGIVVAPFEDPRGVLDNSSWYLQLEAVKQALNKIHTTSVSGKAHDQYTGRKIPYLMADDRILAYLRPSPPPEKMRFNDIDTEAFARVAALGFMSKQQIANYQAEFPLNRSPIDKLLLPGGTSCFGDPVRYKASGASKELELYAFVRAVIVIPDWWDYAAGSPAAQQAWHGKFNFLLRHEMMHLFDFVDTVNEVVFRMKGEIGLQNEMIAQRATPYDAARMGAFRQDSRKYFEQQLDDLMPRFNAAIRYFHNAIFAADQQGKQTGHFDIDLKTRYPQSHWDQTSRAYRVAVACNALPVLEQIGFPDEYERMKQICAQGG